MPRIDTSGKGNISECKILMAYTDAGFYTFVPFGSGAPYDLIIDTGARLLRVQVKTGRLRNGCVIFPMQRFSGHRGKAQSYKEGEFDVFAIYCPDNQRIYVFPLGGNPTQGCLRCSDTRNKQKQKIRWARDFEFEAHIRNLREEVELVGLEPTTS